MTEGHCLAQASLPNQDGSFVLIHRPGQSSGLRPAPERLVFFTTIPVQVMCFANRSLYSFRVLEQNLGGRREGRRRPHRKPGFQGRFDGAANSIQRFVLLDLLEQLSSVRKGFPVFPALGEVPQKGLCGFFQLRLK